MLQVIQSRGLPLDRITTTDVWATDTIPANFPPMQAFKDRMDERIWDMYRIEVEHLCALNKDGTKKTYEQMFYHVPVRRSQTVKVEREREREQVPTRNDPRIPGSLSSVVSSWTQTECHSPSYREPSRGSPHPTNGASGVRSSSMSGVRVQGFPAQISPWCRKLKIDFIRTPFSPARSHDGQREISWNTWALLQTSQIVLASSTSLSVRRWLRMTSTRICVVCTASIAICWPQHTKPRVGTAAGSATTKESTNFATYGESTRIFGHC